MTLTTHALVGAAAASLIPAYPGIGFLAGFASHLAADALPHWDYGSRFASLHKNAGDPLDRDMRFDRHFLADFAWLAGDALLGTALALAVFWWGLGLPAWAVFLGACGGLAPDALQFAYFKLRPRWMEGWQRFHSWIQPERNDKRYLLVEAALVLACIAVVVVAR